MNTISALRNIRASFFRPSCCLRQTAALGAQSRYLSTAQRRSYAALAQERATVPDNPKPKPKAATQLRRSASDSLPIRSNPTPTRGDIRPVFVLTTAERYNLPQLRSRSPPSSQFLHEAWWVPKWGPKGREGEIFVFQNGSFVCWGLGEQEAEKFSSEVIGRSQAQVGRLVEPETEDVEFVTDPNE